MLGIQRSRLQQRIALIAKWHLEAQERTPIEAVITLPRDRDGFPSRAVLGGRCIKGIGLDLAKPCFAANPEREFPSARPIGRIGESDRALQVSYPTIVGLLTAD